MAQPIKPGMTDRRNWMRGVLGAGAAAILSGGCARRPVAVLEVPAADGLLRFPGKAPLRALNDRPPLLESPWSAYQHDLTPNELFYVRWHLQVIPTSVDRRTWRLKVAGHVERPLELSMDDLKKMDATSLVAVNQCSGNSRSFFSPPIPGGQWRNGAMGNAHWTGVKLRDVLKRAGLKSGSADVSFHGLDNAGLPTVPDFAKSLTIEHANEEEVLLAYEMNGEPLPMLNGFPLRLVVPG
jgi:DMSO/TMAO reductase YedYZ molybdopterin-dependent catalytic subunit